MGSSRPLPFVQKKKKKIEVYSEQTYCSLVTFDIYKLSFDDPAEEWIARIMQLVALVHFGELLSTKWWVSRSCMHWHQFMIPVNVFIPLSSILKTST
jgi:hypothetical protein